MHDAKRRQCRGGIGMATDGVVSSATTALELEAELRAAIAGDGLVLDYQPVVGPDGTVLVGRGARALAAPERGLIPPAASCRSPSAAACCASWTCGCCAPPRGRRRAGPAPRAGAARSR